MGPRAPDVTGIVALVLVAIAGVITALGDTLFPARSLAEGIASDFASTASFLIRLRVIHPALAIAAALWIALIAMRQLRAGGADSLNRLSTLLLALLGAQIFLGTLTFLLRAPLPLQLAHLLTADGLWITLVLFTSERASGARHLHA
jgi:heme A synthase